MSTHPLNLTNPPPQQARWAVQTEQVVVAFKGSDNCSKTRGYRVGEHRPLLEMLIQHP
jgi:hypothetical protein